MKQFHAAIMEQFPVRRKKEERKAFRDWCLQQAQEAGWSARIEETDRTRQQNVVIGDPDHAQVLFTAHLDTESNLPFANPVFPRNFPLTVCWHLLVLIVLLAISGLITDLCSLVIHQNQVLWWILIGTYLAQLIYLGEGPSNRNNANGSSGLAAALELMAALPEEDRDKCAFILFDGFGNGRRGSKGYAKIHLELAYMRMFVNLDSVGVGDRMLLISTSMARRCTGYRLMERVLADTEGKQVFFADSKLSMCSSDAKSFKCGIDLIACTQKSGIGNVVSHLRTKKDTVCDSANLEWVVRAFTDYLHQLGNT